jgi:hypothetical protein
MRRSIVRALLIAFPALMLILTPAVSSATNFKSTTTVSIKSASLAPGGVNVTVGYSCFPFGSGAYFYNSFGDVRVGQVSGATGDQFFHPTCNDRNQTETVFVAGPFTAGDAAIGLFVCGFDCNSTTKEVRVR